MFCVCAHLYVYQCASVYAYSNSFVDVPIGCSTVHVYARMFVNVFMFVYMENDMSTYASMHWRLNNGIRVAQMVVHMCA